MSPTTAIMSMFRQYATFSGRAGRSEFWWPFLFVALLHVIPAVTGSVLLLMLVWAPLAVPFLAVIVRRLHDTSRSKRFVYVLLGASLALLAVLGASSMVNVVTTMELASQATQEILVVLMAVAGLLLGAYLVAGLILMVLRSDMAEHRSIIGVLKLPALSVLLLVVAGGVWVPLAENRIAFSPYEAETSVGPYFTEALVWGLFMAAVLIASVSFLIALLVHLACDSDPEPNRYGPPLLEEHP